MSSRHTDWRCVLPKNCYRRHWAAAARRSSSARIQGLPANATYALARLGRLEEAVEALEAGRARLLAEALEANRRDLERLPELSHGDLLSRYRAAAESYRRAASAGQPVSQRASRRNCPSARLRRLTQEIQAARGELDAAIAAIRQVPGYEDFFLPPTFEKIRQAATPDAPLVYLVATSAGGLALVVHRPDLRGLRSSAAAERPRRSPGRSLRSGWTASAKRIWTPSSSTPAAKDAICGVHSSATKAPCLAPWPRPCLCWASG